MNKEITRLADNLTSKLFATRDNIDDCVKSFYGSVQRVRGDRAPIIEMHILLNSVAKAFEDCNKAKADYNPDPVMMKSADNLSNAMQAMS